jgi:hypothetical protein
VSVVGDKDDQARDDREHRDKHVSMTGKTHHQEDDPESQRNDSEDDALAELETLSWGGPARYVVVVELHGGAHILLL